MMTDREIQDLFRQEATERIETMEAALLQYDPLQNAEETLDDLFRSLHTIKGSGNMAGFLVLGNYVHKLESTLAVVKSGSIKPGSGFASDFFKVCDILRELVQSDPEAPWTGADAGDVFPSLAGTGDSRPGRPAPVPPEVQDQRGAEPGPSPAEPAQSPEATVSAPAAREPDLAPPPPSEGPLGHVRKEGTWHIRLENLNSLFAEGISPVAVIHSLEGLGRVQRTALLDRVPPLPELEPESCMLGWELVLTGGASPEEIREHFAFLPSSAMVDIAAGGRDHTNKAARALEDLTARALEPSRMHGLLCKVADTPFLVPSEGIRACRRPDGNIQRPMGICNIDGVNETVIDLPTVFGTYGSNERVLVLLESGNLRFCLAVETFEDFMEGNLQTGGLGLLKQEGTKGFILDPEGGPVLVLDMDWFKHLLLARRVQT